MNYGFIICGLMGLLFLVVALIFMVLKGKATKLISGYNFKTKEERKLYDNDKMSRDFKNMLLLWSFIFILGALLSLFISQFLAVPVFIIWLVLFFRNVHFDDQEYEKYRIKER